MERQTLEIRLEDTPRKVGGSVDSGAPTVRPRVGAPPPAASAVGRRVGQFVLEAFVRGSGPAAVYRARRLGGAPGGSSAAVTILRSGAPRLDDLRAFERERDSLESLRHPAIPRLLGLGTTRDGWPWFATDWVAGRPLIEHARLEGLGLAERVRLLIEMCRTVGYAHSMNVLHPDLRGGSLLVTPSGEPRVVGFGVPGSAGIANVDALGRITYELLSDVRPHLVVLRGGGPPRPPYLPRLRPRPRSAIDHVCLQAIRSRGRSGYATAPELADDLQRVLDRRPVSVSPPGLSDRLLRLLHVRGRTTPAPT